MKSIFKYHGLTAQEPEQGRLPLSWFVEHVDEPLVLHLQLVENEATHA